MTNKCDVLEFPSGLPKIERKAVEVYKFFEEKTRKIAENPKISPAEKQKQLETLAKTEVKEAFFKENLSLSLIEDRINAFKKEATLSSFDTWVEFLEHNRRKAAGTGRLVIALGNETPSAILPAESLWTVRQVLYELEGLKTNLSRFGKCLIPQELLKKYDVRATDFGLSVTPPQVQALITESLNRLEGIMKDVEVLPSLIQSRRLRFGISVILSLTNSMIKKYKKADMLQKKAGISVRDRIRARLFALGKWFYAGLPRKGIAL